MKQELVSQSKGFIVKLSKNSTCIVEICLTQFGGLESTIGIDAYDPRLCTWTVLFFTNMFSNWLKIFKSIVTN